MNKKEIAEKLRAILAKIEDNKIGAWESDLESTSDAVITENHQETEDEIAIYNGWLDELNDLLKELDAEPEVQTILEALQEYEGTDFIVNDELLEFIENVPEKQEKKCLYFLFGRSASRAFDESDEGESNESIADRIKTHDYALFFWEEGVTHPLQLVDEYDGYEGYSEITKELYELL